MEYKAIYYISWKYLWRNKEKDRQREMRRKSALKIWMKCVIFQDISISKRARSFHLKVRSQSLKTKLEMNSRNLQPKDLWMNSVIIARALRSSHVSIYEVQIFKNKEITRNHWKFPWAYSPSIHKILMPRIIKLLSHGPGSSLCFNFGGGKTILAFKDFHRSWDFHRIFSCDSWKCGVMDIFSSLYICQYWLTQMWGVKSVRSLGRTNCTITTLY